jgi:hypothetical protein
MPKHYTLKGGGGEELPKRKRKQGEYDTNSNYSPTFKQEMQRVDDMMCVALPRASQRRQTRALRRLYLEQANLNGHAVPEIGEMSAVAIMELSDGSDNE